MPSGLRYGVEVRGAVAADGPEIVRLLAVAGAVAGQGEVAERLEGLRARAESAVLVTAGYAGLNGLVAVQWTPVLHLPRPLAQITLMVVDPDERRHGIGRLLLKAASQAARSAGCDWLEVVAGGEGMDAFCRAAGFAEAGMTVARSLRKRGAEG